jgi:hypothetical protein
MRVVTYETNKEGKKVRIVSYTPCPLCQKDKPARS